MFTLDEAECLGSCGTAPMMQVNDDYYDNLSMDKIDHLIEEFRSGKLAARSQKSEGGVSPNA